MMRIRQATVSMLALTSFGGVALAQDVAQVDAKLDLATTVEKHQETLQSAVSAAYERNPSILAQRKARMIADERLKQAHSANLPQVSVSTSAGYSMQRSENAFFTNESNAPQTTFGLEVTQNLWSGGRVEAAIGEANAGVKAASSQLFSSEQQMILEVVTVYMDVLASQTEVEIRQNNVAVLERQVQAASDRFEVGEVTRTDVAQAQARHAGARAELASSRATLEGNRARFQELVGLLPVQLADTPDAPAYPDSLEAVLNEAQSNNPDLLVSKAAVEAAEQRLNAAKSARRPNISIVGSTGLSQTYDDDTFENENTSVVAQLQMPLFQGGKLKSQVRAASLERDQLRLQHRANERALIAQVTRAWHVAGAAQRAIEASERQVEAAKIAFEGAEQELAVGLRTTLDTLDQEQELLNARLSLIQARRSYYIAAHQLIATMGKLTPETLGVNISL